MRHLAEHCAERTETSVAEHQGGRAEVRRCLDCGADAVAWLVEPQPLLPGGVEPLRVPNTNNNARRIR